ncbi:MAG: cytochrome b/b6 domain-containing protein [Pseudomonadota bacterium]
MFLSVFNFFSPVHALDGGGSPEASTEAAPGNPCLDCHGDDSIEAVSERGKKLKLHVKADALQASVHADVGCTDCHVLGAEADSHYEAGLKKVEWGCAGCHDDVVSTFTKDCIHGRELAKGNPKAPNCQNCHGGHDIRKGTDPDSQMAPLHQPDTCGACHGGRTGKVAHPLAGKRLLVERYQESVHFQQLKAGKPAASCSDCHGSHNILPSSDTNSQVTRLTLLNTCAKCHAAEVQAYSQGAHGKTLLHGNQDVPTCITCHGDHDVMSLKTQAGGKRDFAATQVCIWCHGNQRMMARYDLDTSQVDSYMRDVHGLMQRGSSGASATCADCHEAHQALPSTDENARMNPKNRAETCASCHGKVSETFAQSFSHATSKGETTGGVIKHYIVVTYVLLIIAIIGAMFMHNLVIWVYFVRRKLAYQKQNGVAQRLSSGERLWHLFLLGSFFLLVLTGFALSFSDAWMFRWLLSVGITEGVRGLLHRIGAVVNTGAMGVVLVWAFTRAGRQKWWVAMFPRWRDVRDFIGTMKYYLTLQKEKPRFALFNYAEKAEYWALWWGSVVMLLTGCMMWFSKSLPESWPNWIIDAARTVHYYEAVLATLAIGVWHLFHVIFHPEEYPLSTILVTGNLTEHEAHDRFDAEAIREQAIPVEEPAEPLSDKPWMEDGEQAGESKGPKASIK